MPDLAKPLASAEAALLLPDLEIRYYTSETVPEELINFRQRAFVDEMQFLTPEQVVSANDGYGVHIGVYALQGQKLVGATHVMLAEQSDFATHVGLPASSLKHCVLSSRTCVAPEARYQSIFSLLIYAGMRWGRLQHRTQYVGHIEEGLPPIRKMLNCRIYANLPVRVVTVADRQYNVVPVGGNLDYAMHRAYQTMTKGMKAFARQSLMTDELELTLNHAIQEFYKNPWFDAVWEGTLSKDQYAVGLANLHQYVRWTTRLLATIAGVTADQELRAHFLDHLSGEIDHERMLERDLLELGYDLDFLTKHMVPQTDIFHFMSVQQSLAAFDRDPVVFLAVPLVAEGLSANLSEDFLKMLGRCAASWGLARPKAATTFLSSHIHTDGGERGHWQAVINVVAKRIDSETTLQRLLAVIRATSASMSRAYHAYMETPDLGAQVPTTPASHAEYLGGANAVADLTTT